MTTFQIIAVVISVFIALTYFIDFKALKNYLMTKKTVTVAKPDVPKLVIEDEISIHQIVEQWELLKNMCEQKGLTDSAKALDTVFLAIIKKQPKV